ncbi:MAG TPA: serine--tRNA ligase, partial [Candidatus Paceibacterota bacterium]
MLDIKFIRENPDLIKEAARKKRLNFDVQALLDLDEKRLGLLRDVETMRAKQNEESEKISRIIDIKEKREAIDNVKELKEDLAEKEHKLKKVQAEWGGLMLEVPNVPDLSVPDGETDKENKEVEKWGDIPKFGFEPKNHIELMERLNMLDLERGSKVGGFRGYFLKGDAVMLNFAILSFALEKMINHGFIPFMAPSLARDFNFIGTGWLPQGAEEVYKTQDDLYLAGTSEVPMMGYHSGEVLKEEE